MFGLPETHIRRHANTIGKTGIRKRDEYTSMSTDSTADETRTLDVREIDGEPFGDIMSALEELPESGTLVLINSFEPEPLYGVLRRRGFTYETSQASNDEWRVSITRA